jgi:hypothetical protein
VYKLKVVSRMVKNLKAFIDAPKFNEKVLIPFVINDLSPYYYIRRSYLSLILFYGIIVKKLISFRKIANLEFLS